MSEPVAMTLTHRESATGCDTAGDLLRLAREEHGLQLSSLAAILKVAPQKLELLEANRFDELPGHAFTRALAQTVSRYLKLDPAAVLALLPPSSTQGLDRMSLGLNQPFHDRPGRAEPADLRFLKTPAFLVVMVILLASVAVYFLPRSWFTESALASVPAPVVVESVVLESVSASIDKPGMAASQALLAAPAEVATPSTGTLQVRASGISWVEVVDRHGVSLFARRLEAGESVDLQGSPPLRVKIGDATQTQLTFNGLAVDLASSTRHGKVAKLELK